MRTAAPVSAACLTFGSAVAGCGGTSTDEPDAETSETRTPLAWDPDMVAMGVEEYLDTYHGETPVRGTVLGVRSSGIVLDVGLEFPLEIQLARVGPLDCGPTSVLGGSFDIYDRAVAAALPGGTEVIGALSAAAGYEDGAYLHIQSEDDAAPAGPSINEVVVRRGEAAPAGAPILSLPMFGTRTEAQADRQLHRWQPPKRLPKVPDGIYWPALKEAWVAAWRTSTGHVAGCVKEAARARKEYDAYLADQKEYEPGGKYYDPDWDLDHYDSFDDDYCDTCRWVRKLL